MSARIRLDNPADGAGRLVLGYNAATRGYYSVGLGGYSRAYVIDEFVPGLRWQAVAAEGSAGELDGSRAYDVEVSSTLPFDIRGHRVIFYDDSIGGRSEVERALRRHLLNIFGEPPNGDREVAGPSRADARAAMGGED